MANLIPISSADKVVVLAADSTPMDTQVLVEALAQEKQFHMIESASSPAAVLSIVKRDNPHIAVVSQTITESGGAADVMRDLRLQFAATRLVVLLNKSDRDSVIKAFRTGAQGVFSRTEPVRLLAKCIRCVHAGQVWASSGQLQFLLEVLGGPAKPRFTAETEALLSPREIDVVVGLTEGLSNREIARRLNLTEHTVKNYLCRIFEKLGVSSRVEVILHALGRTANSETTSPAPMKRPHLVSESPRAGSKPRTTMRDLAN